MPILHFMKVHKMTDPYENIYTVIRGAKHFTLLPPTEGQYLEGMRLYFRHMRTAPDYQVQKSGTPMQDIRDRRTDDCS